MSSIIILKSIQLANGCSEKDILQIFENCLDKEFGEHQLDEDEDEDEDDHHELENDPKTTRYFTLKGSSSHISIVGQIEIKMENSLAKIIIDAAPIITGKFLFLLGILVLCLFATSLIFFLITMSFTIFVYYSGKKSSVASLYNAVDRFEFDLKSPEIASYSTTYHSIPSETMSN